MHLLFRLLHSYRSLHDCGERCWLGLTCTQISGLTPGLVEPLHVCLELALEALDGVAQVLDLLALVKVLPGEARELRLCLPGAPLLLRQLLLQLRDDVLLRLVRREQLRRLRRGGAT